MLSWPDDLIGYEIQKKLPVDNTLALCRGKKANNVLLFGDAVPVNPQVSKAIVEVL